MNKTRKRADRISITITNGVFHPCETPSDNPVSKRSVPDVKRNAPDQSTPDARGWSSVDTLLGGSFGMANIETTPMTNEVAAMT